MRSAIRMVIVPALALFVLVHPTIAQRALPDDNLAYPVLVAIPGVEEASGFYLNTPTSTYLVTAKHVLFSENGQLRGPIMTLVSYPKDPKQSGVNRFSVNLAALNDAGEIKVHLTADVVVVRVAKVVSNTADPSRVMLQSLGGVSALEVANSGILGVATDAVKRYDDVLIGNDVLLFGYPTSLGISGSPQLDPLRPLLRKGIIAGLKPDSKSIILDCPVYYGNSGGPVVEVDRDFSKTTFKVIGVVSQFVPFDQNLINHTPLPNLSNSGYSVVTPMDYVLELVQ
jgi:Trypsin-like peptidase domain